MSYEGVALTVLSVCRATPHTRAGRCPWEFVNCPPHMMAWRLLSVAVGRRRAVFSALSTDTAMAHARVAQTRGSPVPPTHQYEDADVSPSPTGHTCRPP